MAENSYALDINQIRKFLPHRAPFLLVDRILEIHPTGSLDLSEPSGKVGTKVVGLKSVSFNEPFFQGHFPNYSIMPGVLIVECMAQTASFAVFPYLAKSLDQVPDNFSCILVGVDNARFRRPVVPGDQMRVEVEVTKFRGRLWAFKCVATVDGQKVAEADLMANLIDNSGGKA